jgi:hypothetical protein
MWAEATYGGEPSVEVFAKNYYLHWKKKVIGGKIAQFGTCTFTPRTGKTSGEVVELVPCAKNKWGKWRDFLFYVMLEDTKGVPGLPPSILLSHPVLEGKPNANHVCARIRNSRTQRLYIWTSSHNARIK